MSKKHKAEEHQNMEAWVVSYADMLTLLFALFVVLYAIGETKLRKLKIVKESIAWAMNNDHGDVNSHKDDEFSLGEEMTGETQQSPAIIRAQPKAMQRMVMQAQQDFEKESGKSLEIAQSEDTVTFSAPLSAVFVPDQAGPIKSRKLTETLNDLVKNAQGFTSYVRVRIEAPNVVIGRAADGKEIRSAYLCHLRLEFLHNFLVNVRNVDAGQILTEYRQQGMTVYEAGDPMQKVWEDQATLSIAFSNKGR